MSVPQNQIIQNHFQGRRENRLVSLGLPKLDIEAILLIADPSIGFANFSHIFPLWPNNNLGRSMLDL
jgi:hypothetical protein